MVSRPLAAVALALVVLLAGCASSAQGQSADATVQTADATAPTISVSASAQATADPDSAIVRVAVEATAGSADAARQQVATDVDSMREALRDAGIPDDAVSTTQFSVSPRYDYRDESPELVGYRAVHAFAIELDDVTRAGEIIDTAVENGATRVDGVQFTLSEETRVDLREQALTDAMESARADADTIAAAGGLSVTGIHTVSTGSDVSIPFEGRVFAQSDAAGTTIEPGPVTVTASVSVVYTAESN